MSIENTLAFGHKLNRLKNNYEKYLDCLNYIAEFQEELKKEGYKNIEDFENFLKVMETD